MKNKKIVRLRTFPINVVNLMPILLCLYVLWMGYSYFTKEKIRFYEVIDGGMVSDTAYTGMAMRSEVIGYADSSGYINYYIREGRHVGVGNRICSLDATGNLNTVLAQGREAVELEETDLSHLKKELVAFSREFDNQRFSSVYTVKTAVRTDLSEFAGYASGERLEKILEDSAAGYTQLKAEQSGVVSYTLDGMEGLSSSELRMELFDKATYAPLRSFAGDLVEKGKPVYKIITSEKWSLLFPLTEEEFKAYGEQTSLLIHFPEKDITTRAKYEGFIGADNGHYGKLDFDKYMIQFALERFVNFEIERVRAVGLKIPKKTVVERSFFTVPQAYLAKGGNSMENGFYLEEQKEASAVRFVPVKIYNLAEGMCYVDASASSPLKGGDVLVMPESEERYTIGATASLQGVFNINKGYAVFRKIDVLTANDEYFTVEKNMSYGLNVYDHILLDPAGVEEGDFIYQ